MTQMVDNAELLVRFRELRVLVVGDLMLDTTTLGTVTRVSQEAPVPVVAADREEHSPGGAANTAANVAGLGAQAVLFGAVGEDASGQRLIDVCTKHEIDTKHVVRGRRWTTTVKNRIVANGQHQVVRVDRDNKTRSTVEEHEHTLLAMEAELRKDGPVGILVADYNRGFLSTHLLQRIVRLARRYGTFVALDPHKDCGYCVWGLDLMTPNAEEAAGLVGVAELVSDPDGLAKELRKAWKVRELLVTLGAGGMLLCTDEHQYLHLPTEAQEVFDVSGAGDTVAAVYVLARLAGALPPEAAAFANRAAGVVVGRRGTVAINICDFDTEE